MLNIYGYSYVCVYDRTMWIGGAYGSHFLKDRREDQVLSAQVEYPDIC